MNLWSNAQVQTGDGPITGSNTDAIDDLALNQNEHDKDKTNTVKSCHRILWLDIHWVHAFSDVCLIARDRSHMQYINKSVLVANCPLIRMILSGPEYFEDESIHIQTELPRSHLAMLVDFLSQGVLPPEIDENRNLQSSFLSFGIVTKALKLTPSVRTIVKIISHNDITFGQGSDDVVDDILMSEIVKPELDLFEGMAKEAVTKIEVEPNDIPDIFDNYVSDHEETEDLNWSANGEVAEAKQEDFHQSDEENEPPNPDLKPIPPMSRKRVKVMSHDDDYDPQIELETEKVKSKAPKKKGGQPSKIQTPDEEINMEPGIGKDSHIKGKKRRSWAKARICQICGKNFESKSSSSWYTHAVTHKPCVSCGRLPNSILHKKVQGPFHDKTCNYSECQIKFKTWSEHQEHLAQVHNGVFIWKCGKCAMLFETKISHDNHRKVGHQKKRDLKQCTICGISCMALKTHMRVRHSDTNEKFPCELCGKTFDTKYAITRHIKTKSCATLSEPISCQDCGKIFKNKKQFMNHYRAVHRPDNEQPYQCSYCGKGFSQKNAFSEHMNIHTGAKPHKCSYCGLAFNNQSNQKHHERNVHLGIKREDVRRAKEKSRIKIDDKPVTVMSGAYQVYGDTPTFN